MVHGQINDTQQYKFIGCFSDEFCCFKKAVFGYPAKENSLSFYQHNQFNPHNCRYSSQDDSSAKSVDYFFGLSARKISKKLRLY
jgi:hypothetical protein